MRSLLRHTTILLISFAPCHTNIRIWAHYTLFLFKINPCFEKYARWLLKIRDWGDDVASKVSSEALYVLFADEALRTRLDLFIEAEELKSANRELFDNKKTFARGKSALKALRIAKSTQKTIKPGKDDREH